MGDRVAFCYPPSGFDRKHHAGLELHGILQRADPADDRILVERQARGPRKTKGWPAHLVSRLAAWSRDKEDF
jgi:hypothetical protein